MAQSYFRRFADNGWPITVTGVSLTEALDLAVGEREWVYRMRGGLLVYSHLTGDSLHDENPIVLRIWQLLRNRK